MYFKPAYIAPLIVSTKAKQFLFRLSSLLFHFHVHYYNKKANITDSSMTRACVLCVCMCELDKI